MNVTERHIRILHSMSLKPREPTEEEWAFFRDAGLGFLIEPVIEPGPMCVEDGDPWELTPAGVAVLQSHLRGQILVLTDQYDALTQAHVDRLHIATIEDERNYRVAKTPDGKP